MTNGWLRSRSGTLAAQPKEQNAESCQPLGANEKGPAHGRESLEEILPRSILTPIWESFQAKTTADLAVVFAGWKARRAIQQQVLAVPWGPPLRSNAEVRARYLARLGILPPGTSAPPQALGTMPHPEPASLQEPATSPKPARGDEGSSSSSSTSDGEGSIALSSDSEDAWKTPEPTVTPPPGDDFRVALLAKLSYENVLVPAAVRGPAYQTVTVFDWDDTLLCTSYLNGVPKSSISRLNQRRLGRIAVVVRSLLEQALSAGQTFIVTNAVKDWVESSALKYMPEIMPALRRVNVISARHRFESLYPMSEWKMHAFLELQAQLDSSKILNLVSVGDSPLEMEAARALGGALDRARVKTVKLLDAPVPAELLRELEVVEGRFQEILNSAQNGALNIREKSPRMADSLEPIP